MPLTEERQHRKEKLQSTCVPCIQKGIAMKAILEIEFHMFVEEHLSDGLLDAPEEETGILSPEDIAPIRKYRRHTMALVFGEETTLGDVADAILKETECENNHAVRINNIYFKHGGDRFQIDDPEVLFLPIARRHLGLDAAETLSIEIYVSLDAGDICKEDGIRFSMHSKESGRHHLPHVHVQDTQHTYSATLSLIDGKLLAGNFPPRLLRKAQKKIAEDNAFFFRCWTQYTDGLAPDINHHYGYIDY